MPEISAADGVESPPVDRPVNDEGEQGRDDDEVHRHDWEPADSDARDRLEGAGDVEDRRAPGEHERQPSYRCHGAQGDDE